MKIQRDSKGRFVKGNQINLGRIQSEETKEKIGSANKEKEKWITGKHHAEETRKILREKALVQFKEKGHPLTGHIFSQKSKQMMSATKQGISLNEWEKFTSREPYSQNWDNRFKRAIRKRDNYICMMCGVHSEKLNRALCVHHINYDKKLSVPQNCITLCHSCHNNTNKNRPIWKQTFQEKLAKEYGYKYEEENIIFTLMDKVVQIK